MSAPDTRPAAVIEAERAERVANRALRRAQTVAEYREAWADWTAAATELEQARQQWAREATGGPSAATRAR